MASDIPSASYPSSLAMAKVLVQYMDCPDRVRRAILGEFDKAPAHITIERLRREHVEREPDKDQPRPHERWDAAQESDGLSDVNKRFLMRLQIERALSARANGNLIEAARDAA